MKVRNLVVGAALTLLAPMARANEQTPSVKESPLARVRSQLTHYDLEPQGTLALLPQLAEFARTSKGPEAAEAAFLRAAAASDLWFIAGFLGNEALQAGLATQLGVAPEAVLPTLVRELTASASGVYREPALAALATLQRSEPPEQPPAVPTDPRQDARFLRAAAELARDPAVGGKFATLIADPCAGQAKCVAPYADFGPDGRRVFAYLQQLSAAVARLERERGFGDPLFEVLAATIDRDIASVRALTLRLPPRLEGDARLSLPNGSTPWPPPNMIVFAKADQLQYARLVSVKLGPRGSVEKVTDAANVPATTAPVAPAVDAVRASAVDPARATTTPGATTSTAASGTAAAPAGAATSVAARASTPTAPAVAPAVANVLATAPVVAGAPTSSNAPTKLSEAALSRAPTQPSVSPRAVATAVDAARASTVDPAHASAIGPAVAPATPVAATRASASEAVPAAAPARAHAVESTPTSTTPSATTSTSASGAAATRASASVNAAAPAGPATFAAPTASAPAVAIPPTPAPFFPATGTIRYSLTDTSLPTKSIDELVSSVRATRGELTEFRVALVADAGLVSQLPARALVSVRKAGASQILFAAYTKDGALLGAPVRVVVPSIDPTGDSPDLKLRVRLGGYSLDVGRGVIDIPRVRDDSGLHFDLPSLEAKANVRTPRSAAVSFMPDVAAEQILLAMFRVRPAKTPIDLVIQ